MGIAIIWCDIFDMPHDKRDEVKGWVRRMGVDLASVTPRLKIELTPQGFRLHLSQYVLNENGRKILDHAEDRAVTRPLVIELGRERTWPEWLRSWTLDHVAA